MKKFISLFCAIAIVLGANAAPQFAFKRGVEKLSQQPSKQLVEKKSKVDAKKAMEFKAIEQRAPKAIELNAKKSIKVTNESRVAKAPKANQATTDVTVGAVFFQFYEEDNDAYYSLYNEDKSLVYCFDIVVADGLEDVESGKTYGTDDMLINYCGWGSASSDYFTAKFTAASFKKTVAADGGYTIEASATDENGDTYTFNYTKSAFVPQVYNLTMTKASFSYYASDGDLYIEMNDAEENYFFDFDILLSEGQEALESGKTYTLTDMDAQYSKGADYVNMEYIVYSTVSFTRTDAADGSFTVAATVADEKGNTWNLSYYEAPFVPQVYNLTMAKASFSYSSTDGDLYIKMNDAEENYYFYFDILLPEGQETLESGKTYTLDDMLENYTKGYDYENLEYIYFASASFTQTVAADGSFVIAATAVDKKGNTWNLSYSEAAPPTAEQHETITADVTYTSELYWFWTLYTFTAADAANKIEFSIMPDDSFYGTWEAGENKDITGAVTPLNGVASDIYSGSVTITRTDDGFSVTGAVLCKNSVEYTLNLTYTKPEPTREENLTISGLELGLYDGAWQLMGFNADSTISVSIAALADEVSGTYTDADLYGDYTNIVTDIVWNEEGKASSYKEYSMISANLVVAYNEEDGTVTITGDFVGQYENDVPLFHLVLSGAVPEQEPASAENVSFEMKNMTVKITEDYWDLKGEDNETGYYLEIRSLSAEQIAGAYTEADLDDYWTYVGVGNSTYFDIKKASINVTLENEILAVKGTITFVEATTKDTIYAAIDVEGFYDGKDHPDYDENSDFIANFEDVTVITSYISQYGIAIAQAENEEDEYIAIYFYVGTDATGLTAGEYAINTEYEVGTVWAGEGLDDEGYLTGSYAGVTNSQGELTNIWWLVSGKVTVEESGVIVVDALNSYDKLIKCQLGKSSEEAVENTAANAKAVKRLENNTLIIEKNGVLYNVLGAELK